ncbi:MAG: DAK2 domain-containing protein [Candidatus Dormibacteria bacterium]
MATSRVLSSLPNAVSGAGLRYGLERAVGRLLEQRDRINDLNVFPVPDGDTGTNMHLTLEAALAETAQLPPQASVAAVAQAAAHGSLMGARGNSGVILSQVLRGVSAGCQAAEEMGPEMLAHALEQGSTVAYAAVKRPVEGTILSVVRDAAQAAVRSAAKGQTIAEVLQAAVAEAWDSVERSRELLETLREAGVVDAGGFGLAVILSALSEALGIGQSAWPDALALVSSPSAGEMADGPAGVMAFTAPHSGFGYCTEFSLVGAELQPLEVRARLGSEAEDDSALVVGDPGLLHIHIHTHEPWQVLTRAADLGRIERLKVEDMTSQHQEARRRHGRGGREARLALGVVVVAPGFGFHQLLLGLGAAAVVEGGQGMNPTTADLLRGIDEAQADQIILLPNNPNLVLGAEQAARVSRREVAVVPTRNLPQGVAALLAFDPEASLDVNRQRMQREMAQVRSIEVTTAIKDSSYEKGEIARGDTIALLDGQLVAAGSDLAEVVLAALDRLSDARVEVITLYRGARVQVAEAEKLEQRIRARFPEWEVERHDGGQDLYPYIISAE